MMLIELITLTQILNPKQTPPPQPPEPTAIVETIKPKPKPKPKKYIVKKGDTLVKVARKLEVPLEKLWAKNLSLDNENLLEVGQELKVPETNEKLPERPFVAEVAVDTPQTITASTEPYNASDNTYQPGQCVWYVKNRNPRVPNGWGNATDWKYHAQRAGWTVSDKPVAGAVAWKYGHVAIVESVQAKTVTISEMNYNWTPYATRTITIPINSYQYLY